VSFVPPDVIATRDLVGQRIDGVPFDVAIRIGRPYQVDDVSWACPVALDGIDRSLPDIHGIDSWQAFLLATSLVRSRVEHFLEKGGKLYWRHDSSVEATMEDIFGNDTQLRHAANGER
jgi:hypothetical protein